jgi:hypothetical protein
MRLVLVARFAAIAALAVALLPAPADGQATIKASDTTFMKIGILLQSWADWQEVADASGTDTIGYQQNLFVRRARFQVAGQIAKDLTFLYVLDSSNIGKNKAAGTTLTATISTLDAFVVWKLAPEFQLQGGFFYVPLGRSTLTRSSSYLTLDAGPTSFLASAPTQSSSMRDTGFGVMGFLLGDRLQYRAGVYQGERLAGSKNPYRYAGRVQYEFFDTETGYLYQGYLYPGTNLGQRKILAIGAGSDNQGAYHAYAADIFADIPVGQGDAVTGSISWFHYDGEIRFPTLPRQNDYLVEAGYYVSSITLQPFLQFHAQNFSDAANDSKNSRRYQAGLNYYVSGQNLKLTAAYTWLVPKLSTAPATNQVTIQLQIFYF